MNSHISPELDHDKFDFRESRKSARKLNICAVNLLVVHIEMPDSKS
jgi:hypothetical protein